MTTAVQPFVHQPGGEVDLRLQLATIATDAVVASMALQRLTQITQHRSAPHPQRAQSLIELLKLAPESLAFRPPTHDKITSSTATYIVREVEEIERVGISIALVRCRI